MLLEITDNTHLDEQESKKLRFFTRQFVDCLSPSNFATTNPEVIQRAFETKGQSLVDGLKNLIGDIDKGHISMSDESAFKLGENIATTSGAIVFKNELFELIQYHPVTEKVSNRPLVIIPPFINKFYILDLRPENSFVRYALEQGSMVFMISWVNPGRDHSDLSWDDYIESGVFKAFEVVKAITRAKQINTVAWCVGGTLLASALAVLHARENTFVGSATFLTTLLDFSKPGELGVFIDETQVAQREEYVKQTGMLPGKDLALIFSLLRANDLIWSCVVKNYLKGHQPEPFDLLYWNSDPTNLPAKLYVSYIKDMYLENKLVRANALTFCAEKIDLRKIETPCYFLSTVEDHIAPWGATYKTLNLFQGSVEFALGASGHIAGVINPPSKNRRHYWINGDRDGDPQHWLETAEKVPGSWWLHWDKWLKTQGRLQKKAPAALGNAKYKPLEPAPGRYVMKRSD
jgi:polyhydroxyalkanoate synthase